MAFPAKDGTRHHSASRARLHDDMAKDKGAKPKPAVVPKPMEKPAEAAVAKPEAGGDHDVSSQDIQEVVSAYGPAHQIVIHHDQKNGVHTVTSHHGEQGHMHHSEHGSAAEAHDSARMAAGADEANPDEAESVEEAAGETPESEREEMGGAIPGVAA